MKTLFTMEAVTRLFPFLTWTELISFQSVRSDLFAGFTGAIIVLPQAVAFAMIAGLPPQYGLYTAMVTPIIAALFGSSRHLISGPTTAISIVVFSVISQHAEPSTEAYIALTLTLTFIAGIFQIAFGLARLGALVNFVSPSVVTGFTAGAAVLIATSQLKHAFGITIPKGSSFLETWATIFGSYAHLNVYTLTVAVSTLASAVAIKRLNSRLPNMLIAMIVGSVLNIVLEGQQHGVTLVGELSVFLPPFSVPDLSIETMRLLTPGAFAVALLGLIEAVSISRSVAVASRQSIDGNQEFIGQGLSNIVGSFFSSYAGSGSFTRTGLNYQLGAKTPLSAIFAALFLVAILVLVSPLTAYLPIAAMGGVILLVAYNLIEFRHINLTFKASWSEAAVMAVTFSATLFLDLEFAIYAGVLLSLFFYLNRTANPRIHSIAFDPMDRYQPLKNVEHGHQLVECPQFKMIRIEGSIFFGANNHIVSALRKISEEGLRIKHLLIAADSINFIGVAGAEMLVQESERWKELNGGIYFLGLKDENWRFLKQKHFIEPIGQENIFTSAPQALTVILDKLDIEKCRLCQRSAFTECRLRRA
jgi:sulfate permease, SulP family